MWTLNGFKLGQFQMVQGNLIYRWSIPNLNKPMPTEAANDSKA